jgi:glycosyltransferase involved in cell wall biosynthesis
MTAAQPEVSVYLPTRNRAHLLREAVESVLGQTYRNFELLIVDDGSNDACATGGGTQAIIDEFITKDSRIRGFRHEKPLGAPAARNRAIAEARGRYLTGLDDDDLMLPRRLESLIAARPEDHALVCSSFYLEKNGQRRRYNARARAITLDNILHQNLVDNQAMMLTERACEIGGFDESLNASQDYDFWTRLIERFGPAHRIAEPSYVRRQSISADGITGSPRFAEGAKQYTEKHRNKMNGAQLRSQRLLQKITAGQPLRWYEIPSHWSLKSAPLLLRYLASQSPALRRALRR